MRLRSLLFAVSLLAGFPIAPAVAQGQSGTAPADRVAIIPDQDAGAVRILIDGREVATIDADGLHVAGDVAYTGKMTDTGGQEPAGGQPAE